jgi:hypothetical protein
VLNKSEVEDLWIMSSDKERKIKQLEDLRKAKQQLLEEEMSMANIRQKTIMDNYMDSAFKDN